MSEPRLGFPKNSSFQEGAERVYRELGYDTKDIDTSSRNYRQVSPDADFYLMRAQDIPRGLDEGWIDAGITGEDLLKEYCLQESASEPAYTGLGFGSADLYLAARENLPPEPVIATSFPAIADKYLDSMFDNYDVLEAEGSVELFPSFDDVDGIVEVVDSGNTLRQNGLEKIDRILSSQAVLVEEIIGDSEALKNPLSNSNSEAAIR